MKTSVPVGIYCKLAVALLLTQTEEQGHCVPYLSFLSYQQNSLFLTLKF